MTETIPSPGPSTGGDAPRVTVDRAGHLLLIGLNRADKRNAADVAMLEQLALAYGELDRDDSLRVGVVYAHGDHFTGGLDLADIVPRIGPQGLAMVPEGGIHPWGMDGSRVRKPVVLAVQGTCLTLGIELALASDIVVAADDTVFAQLEVARAILPFGGATTRFAARAGWGDAMRWMLTGDRFDAAEAHRMGLVQEVVPAGRQLERARELAERIAAQAPLAVQATLANARLAVREGEAVAEARLPGELVRLMQTEDARIGMQAFLTRTDPEFVGR
ncbi:crotonase/enoyl-CoA hydratase family protein [Microcella frigidaquae]|uniref:Enoyl-CoA hydratase/carnithine racemase n=1 Tax=Microcella frigidaquae TaxID=424758 RepID=A0A840XCD1_9MICO|nr:crotonase/enoyl-CoA hydratase family protein [Microcella frigidaquae]MBB5618804.1 enoyl-CoA hydratase/carnithine racemase [Microcella frigidaquae]NHN44234.1 crotonase/enoyl-CoA hydratase family protein [Microcella frigidaquae]